MTAPEQPAADGLHNYWYIAAREKDVRKKPQAVRLFGRHYAVFHQGGGCYAALLDCCPHCNVPLSIGKVENGCLQCAYHGWSFDGTGRLAAIPALCGCGTPDVRATTAALRPNCSPATSPKKITSCSWKTNTAERAASPP